MLIFTFLPLSPGSSAFCHPPPVFLHLDPELEKYFCSKQLLRVLPGQGAIFSAWPPLPIRIPFCEIPLYIDDGGNAGDFRLLFHLLDHHCRGIGISSFVRVNIFSRISSETTNRSGLICKLIFREVFRSCREPADNCVNQTSGISFNAEIGMISAKL